jgi:hypothetical protein
MRTLRALWNDDRGFVLSAELVLIGTLCVLGLVAGLTLVRDAVGGELGDIACALRSMDQSYSYSGFSSCKRRGCGAYTAGSCFSQGRDCKATVVSFQGCETPAVSAPIVAPAPVVAPPVIECPPTAVPYTQPAAPAYCPPMTTPTYCPPTAAPTYCPAPVEICPPVIECPPLYFAP